MMNRSMLRSGLGALIAGVMVLGSTSYADEILGTFTLIADLDIGDVNAGEVVFDGDFVIDDGSPVNEITVGSFTFENAVRLQDITITDLSGAIGNFDIDDFALGQGPFAILGGPTTTSTVIGLLGNTGEANNPSIALTFDQANGTQGTFVSTLGFIGSGGGIRTISRSGNQVIPEPSALALLGAGMLAFGAFRFRKAM